MHHQIIRILASGFGAGYIPVAPGTFGSLLGVVIYYFLRLNSHDWFVKFTIGFALVAIFISHLAEKSFQEKDSQKIVIDELAGLFVCYSFVKFGIYNLVLGFILFRLFDVAKIFPARFVQDKVKGGLGVVGDDLVAGAQAGAVLYFLPQLIQWTERGLGYLNF